MPKLSVVVPVYNIEKYLERCILSIVESTFNSLEIILVDDGSTDESGKICDEWEKKFENIKVIHQTNAGLANARKSGVMAAKGEYIAFVDGDDYVKPDLYAQLMEIVIERNVDVICFGFSIVGDEGEIETFFPSVSQGFYQDEEIKKKIMPGILVDSKFNQMIPPCVWGKIFRYNILKNNMHLVPDIVSYGEDTFFSLTALKDVRTLWIDKNIVGYCYYQREDSMSRNHNKTYWESVNIYLAELEKLRNQNADWYCWKNIKTEKQRIVKSALQTEIRESKESSYIVARRIRNIIQSHTEVEKVIKQYQWRGLEVSFVQKLFLLFLKYRFYGVLVILKRLWILTQEIL